MFQLGLEPEPLRIMKFILGTKTEMTQFFGEDGRAHAATVIKAVPSVVVQIKNKERDGYDAVQFGSGDRNQRVINKAQKGHFKELGNFRFVKELRMSAKDAAAFATGQTTGVDAFAPNDTIVVSGISKGKGFQGVVKRHGFHGGPRSHGQKHSEREPGSIGPGGLQRVMKGMRMAGRMGSDRITVKGLKVLAIDPKENLLVVKGAVPGRRGTLIEIIG